MARKLKKADKVIIENIVEDSLRRVNIHDIENKRVALLVRLITAGIANHFFESPDDLIDVGFLRFKKNPEKNELFAVEILKDEESGVTNASTLYRYYTGDLTSEQELKETMNDFVNELLSYSQSQNESISKLTGNLNKRRKQNGI